ncbi:MAG: hypothetical protein WCK70_17335 [Chloroflexales bacterium]
MKSFTHDTSQAAHQRYVDNIRAMSPAERLAAACDLSRRALAQALWVIRRQRPEIDAQEAQFILLGRLYGSAIAAQVRSWPLPTGEKSMQGTLYDAITPVIDVLEERDLAYYIGGSVASITYGIPRATMDVDIAVQMTRRDVSLFVQRLTPYYYLDAESIRSAISNHSSFNLIPMHGAVKIDVFVPPLTLFTKSVFARVAYLPIAPDAPRPYCLPTAEDIILLKLHWYVLGNRVSNHQRTDVIGVLQTQAGQLDLRYLRQWATILNLADVFADVYADAGV